MTLADKLPSLLALSIDYAGYASTPEPKFDNADAYERLLEPICLLTKLRFLSVRFLGLDGTASHTGTRSDTLALKHCVATLNDLRWLYPGNHDTTERTLVSRPFVAKLMEEHPNLAKGCYDKHGRPRQLDDLCVSGKLWED